MLYRVLFLVALLASLSGVQLISVDAQQASLMVSAAETGGKFFGPQIVQVVVDSAGLRDPDSSPGSLLVNSASVPLVHLGDGRWYAFFADRDTFTMLARSVNIPGSEVSASGAFWAVGPADKSSFFPTLPSAFGHDPSQSRLNPSLDLDGNCSAAFAESDACVDWPYIALLSFNENDLVSVRYSGQSVSLKYIPPARDDVRISLDRATYPMNAEIILTLGDYMWNINPAEEDMIHFAFSGGTKVFYQGSFALDPVQITGILNNLGFAESQMLGVEDMESIGFTNTIDGMTETILIETAPNSGVFENIEANADMIAKKRNALIIFEYFGKSTSSSTSTGDADVSVGKEPKEPGEGTQVPANNVTAPLPAELYSVSEPRLVDPLGKRLEQITTGSPLLVEAGITNSLGAEQPFLYIVQVKDSDGFTEMLTWIRGKLSPSGTLEPGISWTPEKGGRYEVHVFVWKSFEDPGLPVEKMMTLDVKD